MAISYVNSSYTVVTAGDATWQVAYPTGTQAGDYLVCAVVYSIVNMTGRDGFTQLEAVENTTSRAVLMYNTANGVDTDADLTFSAVTNGVAIMLAFRNVDSYGDSTANDQTSAGTTNATTSIGSIPSGSTAVAFFIGTDAGSTCTHTTPSGYTEVADQGSNAGTDRSMSACYKLNASSSESPSATASNTQDERIAFLVSLLAESTGGMFLGFSF